MPSARLGPKEPNAEGMDTPHIRETLPGLPAEAEEGACGNPREEVGKPMPAASRSQCRKPAGASRRGAGGVQGPWGREG